MNRFLFLYFVLFISVPSNAQNGTDSVPAKKYSIPLAEDKYWQIVETSKTKKSQVEQYNAILNSLKTLSIEEIAGFKLQTDKLLRDSYKNELWCAAYIINGGCSDDGFEYFRCWLISKGKKVFYESLKNPDYLVDHASGNDMENEFEDFWYVANDAFTKRTGKDIYAYLERSASNAYNPIKFTWSEEEPESMKKICPKLFKKFWDD